MTSSSDADIATILSDFGGDPQRAARLAEFLGFDPIRNPVDQLAGPLSGSLKKFVRGADDRGFGVGELYRVGSLDAAPTNVGLWVGVLDEWGHRSTDRDRPRRRITRALVEHINDGRSLALLVPSSNNSPREAELVYPRTQIGSSKGTATSIRAHLDLKNPTRFHRDLLRDLRIPFGASLPQIAKNWQKQFSVERVTTTFYNEYRRVRDRIADALLATNSNHPVIVELDKKESSAWATRQMGRVLFLWFLQAKRWLGDTEERGSETYLLDLWHKRTDTQEGDYFRGILAPLFFDAMATGSSSRGQHPVLGFVPYLNGGLFRRSALEDRIHDAGEVSLPDEVFDPEDEHSLLNLLSRYRFTTRESTPDDQSVDPDPELLGRVFENLYQSDERHDTGTYYTPREIVHFMCREALDGYLRDRTGVEQSKLDDLRQQGFGSRDEYEQITGFPEQALIDALETVRVCDPAVGSGAFLLGAIQEIVTLRRGILFSKNKFVEPAVLYKTVSDWKRRIIQSSLYGVDINPEAVEICRLRLWLSMVLDMDEPPEPDSGWSLPNLDFQIVAGDSLVDRMAGVTFKESWPSPKELKIGMELSAKLQQLENNIELRRQEFDRTHRDQKRLRELRDSIAGYQREVVLEHLYDALRRATADLKDQNSKGVTTKKNLKKASDLVKRLTSLLDAIKAQDFALVQKPFLWPVAFPDVLKESDPNSGFDIVLANPPYVKHEELDSEDQNSYAEAFPEVYAGTADLLVYFYGRALQILRPDGWLSFITSNKFMRAGYGAGTREHLPASMRIQRIVDFGDLPLFEASGKPVAAYPVVLVGRRSEDTDKHSLSVADLAGPVRKALIEESEKVNTEGVRGILENLDGLLAKDQISDFPQVMLKTEGWTLESPTLIRLFERLVERGVPLGEFVNGRIYYGIKTGLNDAFVIDQAKRDELIEEDPRSSGIIKPWLRGKDIKRWKPDWAGQYVIAIQNSGDAGAGNPWVKSKSEKAARDTFRETYPAIHDHLSFFEHYRDSDGKERGLRIRQDQGKFWWELRACTYYHEFTLPKIIIGHFINEAAFAYDALGSFHNNACSLVVPPSPSTTAIVNSAVGWWLLSHLCTPLQNGYIQVFVQFLEKLPIPSLSKEADQLLSQHVKALASGIDDPSLEREMDEIVFDAYGLSPTERQLVITWLEERREAYGH